MSREGPDAVSETSAHGISPSAARVGTARSPGPLPAKLGTADHPRLVCIGLTGFPCYGVFPQYVLRGLMKVTYHLQARTLWAEVRRPGHGLLRCVSLGCAVH